MIVEHLIKQLQTMPPNAKIVLSQDEEGNGFYKWDGIASNHNGIESNNENVVVLYPTSEEVELE